MAEDATFHCAASGAVFDSIKVAAGRGCDGAWASGHWQRDSFVKECRRTSGQRTVPPFPGSG